MKTVKEIDEMIDNAVRSIKKDSTKQEVDSVKKELVFLRQCKRYLETGPRQEFVESQRNEVQRKIDLIPSHFEDWKTGKVLTKYKNPYNSFCVEMNISGLNAQLKTLNFLLS